MIYRMLSGHISRAKDRHGRPEQHRFGGAFSCGMLCPEMPAPDCDVNPRARFWFTEYGWQQVRKDMLEQAREAGQAVKVIRRKNPKRSQVVYKDQWQVAILPDKKGGRDA